MSGSQEEGRERGMADVENDVHDTQSYLAGVTSCLHYGNITKGSVESWD